MVSTDPSFFISGDCHDQAYKNVPILTTTRQLILTDQSLCSSWNHFGLVIVIWKTHIIARMWNHFLVAILGDVPRGTLRERGFKLNRVGAKDLNFTSCTTAVKFGSRLFWPWRRD